MHRAAIDKLMSMCEQHSGQIADLWYNALCINERTKSCALIPKEAALRHALVIYKNIPNLYFADSCYQAVERLLDVEGLIEYYFAKGIPLEDTLYSLVLLRRYIWIQSENEALFEMAMNDMYEAVKGINRIALIFDYITYVVARRYGELYLKKNK